MRVTHNLPAVKARRNMKINQKGLSKSLEKLSSGNRINRSADDAAGLAISEKMRGQIRGLAMAGNNIQQGLGVSQTADGALNEVSDMLQRMRTLCVQSSNGTYTGEDRAQIQKEVDRLKEEIDRIAYSTNINGVRPLLYEEPVYQPGQDGSDDDVVVDPTYSAALDRVDRVFNSVTGKYTGPLDVYVQDNAVPITRLSNIVVRINGSAREIDLFHATDFDVTPNAEGGCDYTYKHSDASFTVRQTVKKVTELTGDKYKEYFSLDFEIINTSPGNNLKIDLLFKNDILYGPRYDEPPLINGATSGMTNNYWSKTDGTLPNDIGYHIPSGTAGSQKDLLIDCPVDSPYLLEQPDKMMLAYTLLCDWSHMDNPNSIPPNNTVGDYFFAMAYTNKEVTAGGSYHLNYLIGVNAPVTYVPGNPPVKPEQEPPRDDRLWIQAGANSGEGFYLFQCDARVANLGIRDVDVSLRDSANCSISEVDKAINKVSGFRGNFGADINRMEHAYQVDAIMEEELTSSESRIRDLDMAKEMMNMTKINLLVQASQAMISQANLLPQQALQLLQ